MSSFLLLLCGFCGAGLIYLLAKQATKWQQWVLAIGLYLWVCFGFSFVYINSIGYHNQAVSVGATFFGIIALAWAFLVARSMGYIGKKKAA